MLTLHKLNLFPKFYSILKYVFTQSLSHVQDVTQHPFLSGVVLVWIQTFPSPGLIAQPRPKNPDHINIYL